jgi:NAD(P)-dependent dehydrogenase (short-subunit alcohol dehydrogenase family)
VRLPIDGVQNGAAKPAIGGGGAGFPSAPVERRVAIVTGASGGLGTAIASALAAAGFDLVLHYRQNKEAVDALANGLRDEIRATVFQADLARRGEADALAAYAARELGRVDVLVNNAGMTADAPLHKLSDDDWEMVLRTNLTAAMYTTRAVLPGVYERGWGRILNVTSVCAQTGYPRTAAYAASKAGMIGLTKVIAAEGASKGVTCNAVAPGLIDAGLGAGLSQKAFDALLAPTPVGRPGTAEEVGDLCAFLASPAAGYITGQVYAVNGGLHM